MEFEDEEEEEEKFQEVSVENFEVSNGEDMRALTLKQGSNQM